jgi:SAM-dependent methyltransferase
VKGEEKIRKIVRKSYTKVAKREPCCCCSECGEKVGYTKVELESVPKDARFSLGCGNPVALASLKEGETVLDLGSGGGLDCFLAAKKVGEKGHVIGVDMTPEMIDKARENYRKGNYKNVEFRLGEIENLPVADNTADVIISNCVINLSPTKERVFKEAFRVLKPSGRLIISDIALLKELPETIKRSKQAYIACISGAIMKDEYIKLIKNAGFQDVKIIEETNFLTDFIDDPSAKAVLGDIDLSPEIMKALAGSVVSVKIYGIKPK